MPCNVYLIVVTQLKGMNTRYRKNNTTRDSTVEFFIYEAELNNTTIAHSQRYLVKHVPDQTQTNKVQGKP